MNPEQFRQLEELYEIAAAMAPGDRTRFIAEHCHDETLRRELMAAFRETAIGLTAVVEQAAAQATSEVDWTGRRVGPYQIVRSLGRGGMGSVYLAVRDDDEFHKEVAVKTLKFELDGSAVLRFRHERQILAHLEHANIARLLDGGTTEHGTPYIVLEYVAGEQVCEWCERQRLSVEQRLRLFRLVCDAVQYAHQHLIVHRDIKPGNILVTPEGVPKLLDFGIAKLLDAGALAGAPQLTATAALLMTPDYVSPEQVRGEPVSTATDVYSLGAVLYELLTGQRPHALVNYDAAEIARVVCDTDIRPPSALGHRRLRGDLDNIVLKAMHKDPTRRYASVAEFSEDIRRHLHGLPVAARPDTAIYRTTKFLRRHRLGVAATAAVVVSLAAGIAISVQQARIAERRFAQLRELANTFLFKFYEEVTPLAGSTAVRASIVDTARRYLDGLSNEAGNDRGLILELAQAYQRLGEVQSRTGTANLGQVEAARGSYQRALDLYARVPVNAGSPQDLRRRAGETLLRLSNLEYSANHEDTAEQVARRMLDLIADRAPDAATRRLRAFGERRLGDIRLRLGHTADALALMESARNGLLELQSSGFADPTLPTEIADTRDRLARVKVSAGDLDGALRDFQELVDSSEPCDQRVAPGAACRYLGVRLERTADVYGALDRPNLNQPDKAASLYQQALQIQERFVAQDPNDRQARFDLAARSGKLGDALWKSDPTRALALYERALTTAQTLVSKEQYALLQEPYLVAISRPLILLGRTAEARKALTEVLAGSKTDAQTPYPDRLGDIEVRAIWPPLLLKEGRREEAQRMLNELIRETESLRASHPDDLTPIYFISEMYRMLASTTTGSARRDALLNSARAWHSWPATTFTTREEQADLAAANR